MNFPYIPLKVNSSLQDLKITEEVLYWYPWIAHLKNKNTYLFLHAAWKRNGAFPDLPPPGYDYYITSGDSLMFGLPEYIAPHVQGKIIHLTGSIIPDLFDNDQLRYVSYNTAHRRIARIPKTPNFSKNIKFKASALTNRVTQSKAIVFAALMHYLGSDHCITSLRHQTFLKENVHGWEPSGNATCDQFTKMFTDQWLDKFIHLPDDDNQEGSYNNTAYKQAALNFTQESYHYSYTVKDGLGFCQPGPFITEKTWKCLLSSTAFIFVGQCYAYRWLSSLGLKFDYGELDLGFDEDQGNLTRLEKIVKLVESLDNWTAEDLFEMTRSSSEYNAEYVRSQDFWKCCEHTNSDVYKLLAELA